MNSERDYKKMKTPKQSIKKKHSKSPLHGKEVITPRMKKTTSQIKSGMKLKLKEDQVIKNHNKAIVTPTSI
jgi:hypothetical protein